MDEPEQDEPASVVFFGRTGEGKSTLANMLIQEDLRPENSFPISDGALGETYEIAFSQNKIFEVYDTIGLCEPDGGKTPHKKAIKKIRFYFSKVRKPLHYICYVKKKGRFTDEDKEAFKEFKRIFKGGENNFIIIITNSTSEWIIENSYMIREYFGNYPVIAVDFPFDVNYDSNIQRETRKQSKDHLVDSLLTRKHNGVVLEVLTATQEKEAQIANTLAFVPVIGAAYKLISSSVYYFALNKPELAKGRLVEGILLGGGNVKDLIGCDPSEVPGRISNKLRNKTSKTSIRNHPHHQHQQSSPSFSSGRSYSVSNDEDHHHHYYRKSQQSSSSFSSEGSYNVSNNDDHDNHHRHCKYQRSFSSFSSEGSYNVNNDDDHDNHHRYHKYQQSFSSFSSEGSYNVNNDDDHDNHHRHRKLFQQPSSSFSSEGSYNVNNDDDNDNHHRHRKYQQPSSSFSSEKDYNDNNVNDVDDHDRDHVTNGDDTSPTGVIQPGHVKRTKSKLLEKNLFKKQQ